VKTRLSRLLLAVGLLAVVWPAVARLLGSVPVALTGLAAAHPTGAATTIAGLLLASVLPGPVERAVARLTAK
jgi:hypothetical protein